MRNILNNVVLVLLFGLLGCDQPMAFETASQCDAGDVILANKGKANAIIVMPENATKIQKAAIKDLQAYLGKITGGTFELFNSLPKNHKGSVIYAGKITPEFAKKFNVDYSKIPMPGGWVIATKDNNLLLGGLDNKGVVQAVYRLLEDYFGVHWWTLWDEYVPHDANLKISKLHDIGQPDFPLGHDSGAYSRDYLTTWAMRNRMLFQYLKNGQKREFVGLNYGRPFTCHSLEKLVPAKIRKRNPQWVALHGGKRDYRNRGLCFTNPQLQNVVSGTLQGYISRSNRWRDNEGIDRAYFFYVGADDGAKWCRCQKCMKLFNENKTYAASTLEMTNNVAKRIKHKNPDVLIGTLAYQKTRMAPKTVKPEDNVLIIWCPERQNLGRPLTDKVNDYARGEFESWLGDTKNLGIFYYGTTFGYGEGTGGYGTGLPNNALKAFHEDLKYYKKHGVKYFHIDSRPDLYRHMPDLTLWMRGRLQLDVDRDFNKELMTFTNGYYGPAGKYIREYLAMLDKATSERPGNVWFYAEQPDYDYLDLTFLVNANKLWGKAAAAVKSEPQFSARVASGRMSVDRAILVLWPELVRQWLKQSSANKIDNMPLDREQIFSRYEKTFNSEYSKRAKGFHPRWVKRCYSKKDKDIKALKNNVFIPAKAIKGIPGITQRTYYDYPAGGINYAVIKGIQLIKDKASDCGQAFRIPQNGKAVHDKLEYDPNRGYVEHNKKLKFDKLWSFPIEWGVQPKFSGLRKAEQRKITREEVKRKGSGYHWYKLGAMDIKSNDHVRLFKSHAVKIYFRQRGEFELYVRLKFDSDVIFLDRAVIVSRSKPKKMIEK